MVLSGLSSALGGPRGRLTSQTAYTFSGTVHDPVTFEGVLGFFIHLDVFTRAPALKRCMEFKSMFFVLTDVCHLLATPHGNLEIIKKQKQK